MEEAVKMSFKREMDALATIRDELKLKAHLAKADMKDELNHLEHRWQRLEEEVRRSSSHMKEPLEDIGQSAKDLLTELKRGYENVKSRLV
jgi:signal transduction histidine kinase